MKQPLFPRMIALLALVLIAPLSAQNLVGNPDFPESRITADGGQPSFFAVSALPGTYEVPAIERAQGELSNDPPVIAAQDAGTLDARVETSRAADSDLFRKTSVHHKARVSAKGQPYQISEDSFESSLAMMAAVYRESGKAEKSADCSAIALSVEQQVKLNPADVLEIVEREVGANPACSCEVVKAAITASEAGVDEVVAIVEAAIHVSPESMRIVSQCAIAAMPDSIAGVQALLSRLDPNAGESGYSSKGAKSGKVASIIAPPLPNPLDLPPAGPPLTPPPIFPPYVTDVNP